MWLRIFCHSFYSMYRKSENLSFIVAQRQWDHIKLLPYLFLFINLSFAILEIFALKYLAYFVVHDLFAC